MRLLVLAFVLLLPGFLLEAAAQNAAPQLSLASYVEAESDAATIARQHVQARLSDDAEQHRLKALANLGLGKPDAARREADRLVTLLPDYVPQHNDPAGFVALVLDARQRLAAHAVKTAPALAATRN